MGPPVVPSGPYAPARNIKEMSLLHWAEHCVECAAPSCYQTCDLYQPRFDLRCRRFTYGALRNRRFPSLRGYGVEISFKKWAKIETYGNLTLMPVAYVRWMERLAIWGTPIGKSIGRIMARATGKLRWYSAVHVGLEELVRRFAARKQSNGLPEAFLLEVYNPASETIRMQLSFQPVKDENASAKTLLRITPGFVTTAAFPGGYSRYEIGVSLLRPVLESGRPFVISLIPEADNHARLVFLTADFVRYVREPKKATETKKIKCVVWDLDNTAWEGTLVEGDTVALGPEFVALLKHFDSRGILQSIASKNDYASAWQKLEAFGISEYFLFPQIHWGAKSESLKTIAERLNIGLDSIAFVDDSPFELDQVARTLPEVTPIRAAEAGSLFSDPRFEGSSSVDSKQRRKFYREGMQREMARDQLGQDDVTFLKSCEIKLDISPCCSADSERVAELVQRTNQLNFSGHKYTRDQLKEILNSSELEKLVLKCSDNYGSYGSIGFGLVQKDEKMIRVQDFMLSCRVQGKRIEQAFFAHLLEHHNPESLDTLWVNFRATARNKPAQQVLDSLGFRVCGSLTDGLPEGMILPSAGSLQCEIIQVRCSAAVVPDPRRMTAPPPRDLAAPGA